jgi:Low psii accumulation1 / Rep27
MTNNFKNNQNNTNKNNLNSEKYAYLKAEAEAPYKGFRKFIYLSIGASGAIGGFIFFIQLIAGKSNSNNIPNLLIQILVMGLMIFLYRWEDRNNN